MEGIYVEPATKICIMNIYRGPLNLILMAIAILLTALSANASKNKIDPHDIPSEALQQLSSTINHASVYQNKKIAHLDSLKSTLKSDTQHGKQWETLIEIASQYRQMNADSSMHYAERALAESQITPDDSRRIRSQLCLVTAVSTAGIFPPAVQTLDSISRLPLSPEIRIEFWKAGRVLYSYMSAFVKGEGKYADLWKRKYIQCDDSLLVLLSEKDPFRKFIFAERMVSDAKWDQAKTLLEQLLATHQKADNIYGMSAYQLAIVHRNLGAPTKYAECLALSAESDIIGCVKEGIALPNLAEWLYEEGDLDNAFRYINFALEEANSGNMRMRTVSIGASMPLIDEAYRKKIDQSNDMMLGYLIISTTLLLIAIVLSAILVKNIKSSKAKERKLAVTSKKLEAYVGNFIGLCSNYASRLDQFAKLVSRKINAGQGEELLRLVATGRYNDDDNETFYRLIDKAILDIFPDFVESINTLLQPDKQIELKSGELLSPELRIYAFVRLGVDQSNKISQILNYSPNTVYSYRNRMRNRAIDRDNFDSAVANLGNQPQDQGAFLG